MRILSVVRKNYYGIPAAIEPLYLYFTVPLQEMGHAVDVFDHYEMSRIHGRERATALLVERIRRGAFELVLYQTSGREPVDTAAFADLSAKVCIAAWNSDDDWQWDTTRRLAPHFTFMVTTYDHVFEQNRAEYPTLFLSQWGCLGMYSDFSHTKDIGFSFAGALYGSRNPPCRYLRRQAGLVCFGRGSRLVNRGLPYVRGVLKFPWFSGPAIQFREINEIWNRSRISYTPMAGGPRGEVLSIKSRTFDMGLSGTLMLCEHSPDLECFYEPGEECVSFESLDDCAEKARWYLAHEAERAKIAHKYCDRTLREHLWTHRFSVLFQQMGFKRETARTTCRSAESCARQNAGL
jgi:Glycosyl transferases group 1